MRPSRAGFSAPDASYRMPWSAACITNTFESEFSVFGLQTARTGLRYRNPVIERTAISRVSKSFRGDLQLGKVAMPRGPRSEKRPADVIGAGRYLPWASPKLKLRH